jgi:hypothetical protein
VAIHEDADTGGEGNTGALSLDEAADAFLKRFENTADDAEKPSDADADEKRKETARTTEGAEDEDPESDTDADDGADDREDPDDVDTDEDGDDDDKSSNEKPGKPVTDDDIVEITVDGETKRASVRELKRLFGQEAALTRKNQEVAEQRKTAETERTRYAAGLDAMVQRAREAFQPYAEIDFLLAQQRMSPEDFAALRKDHQAAHDTLRFLEGELDTFIKDSHARAESDLKARAKEAIATLSDPEKGIPGWNNTLYDEIRTHSITQGLSPELVNTIVDPVAIKVLWKAMRYDKAQSEAKTKVQRKVNSPKKVIKTQARDERDGAATSRRDALSAMRKTGGTLDSAADAFLAFARKGD